MAKNGMANPLQSLAQAPADHAYTANSKPARRNYFESGMVASKTMNHIMENADKEFDKKKAAKESPK